MNFKFILTASILALSSGISFGQQASSVYAYIAKYKDLAIAEQKRTGVPAAIKLAQGIHESGCGESELSLNAMNHFGIKCKTSWTGATYTYTDDAKNECFRKYDNDRSSYMDHSDFLKSNARYATLFTLDATDYKGWAYGLKKCGYATNPKYAQKIVDLIEKYELNQYSMQEERGGMGDEEGDEDIMVATTAAMAIPETKPAVLIAAQSTEREYYVLTVKNGLKGFYGRKGDLLLNAAYQNNIRYAKLLDLNDLSDEPLPADMFIYLERKNKEGTTSTYELREGESLITVAQEQGIRVKELRQYNHLRGTEEPEVGAVLYLKNTAPKKPLLRAPLFGKNANPEYTKAKENNPAYVSGGKKAAAPDDGIVVAEEADNTALEVAPPSTENKEETYNIADEPAVEEQIAAEQNTQVPTSRQPEPVSKASEAEPAEEMSDLDRLKAKLDRSVYGSQNAKNNQAPAKPVSNNNTTNTSRPAATTSTYETRPAVQSTTTRPVASNTYAAESGNSGKAMSQDELKKRIEANRKGERETPVVANHSNAAFIKPEQAKPQVVAAAPVKEKPKAAEKKSNEKKVAEKKGTEKKGVDKKGTDKKGTDKKVADKKAEKKPAKPGSHTVKKGETVTAIADKYNLTTKEVIKLNKLSTNGAVKPGMKLKLK